jgi:GNAT superfamily N-acetyltransferase
LCCCREALVKRPRLADHGIVGRVPVRVRAVEKRDASSVARLLDALGYPASTAAARGRLERLQHEPDTRIFVAESDEGVVGLAGMHVMRVLEYDDPVCVMIGLVVRADQRRKGIGEILARAVEDGARARGCGVVVLGSAERRADAHAFYERVGYERTGRRYLKRLL